jgi:hypothetical protein
MGRKTELQKLTKDADARFSQFIRNRDGRCVRCGKVERLQCSHFWNRRKWATRYDPDNCDTLCWGCHRLWEYDKAGAYRDYMLNKLGGSLLLSELRAKSEILIGQRNAVMAALEWL